MTSRTAATCAACHDRPVTHTTICPACQSDLERDLGDIGALVSAATRMFRTDPDARGTDRDPVVRSRRRGKVIDPATNEERPEPFRAGEFGRAPAMPWETDRGLARDLDMTVSRQARIRTDGGIVTDEERRSCPDCDGAGFRDGLPRHDPRARCRSCHGSGVTPASTRLSPLSFDVRAADVAHDTARRLDHWVRVLHVESDPWPVADIAAVSRWLLARMGRAVVHPAADELERDIRRVVGRLRMVVDRPADRWYAGPCDTPGCVEEHLTFDDDGRPRREEQPTTLYADPELKVVACRRCGAEFDVEARRVWLLDAAQDQLAHAELIGRAAPALGVEITPAAIRGYAARGRVSAHSTDEQGRPLYRVGDVIDVARDVLARKAEARERSERKQSSRGSRRSA